VEYHLKKRYGLETSDVDEMLEAQGNACAICREVFNDNHHIDHDHQSGKVRGLLCGKCNRGIGMFSDDPDRLVSAIKYLKDNVL